MQIQERFKGAPWYQDNPEHVLVAGAGGIGSWAALFLSRANFRVTLVDDDEIEVQNIGGQFFKTNQIGFDKVKAVEINSFDFGGTPMNTIKGRIPEASVIWTPYIVGAFDNMQARKDLFKFWKEGQRPYTTPLLIDGRLEAEDMQIFCVTPDNMDFYEEHYLFDDSEIEISGQCSFRQTSHAAAMIGSYITSFLTNHITNILLEDYIRDIPFLTEISLANAFHINYITTKNLEQDGNV